MSGSPAIEIKLAQEPVSGWWLASGPGFYVFEPTRQEVLTQIGRVMDFVEDIKHDHAT